MNSHDPHGTDPILINGKSVPRFPGPILPEWQELARNKGFQIVARIEDRLHLALRCLHCEGLMRCKLFTLRSCQPLCPHCLEVKWKQEAASAGVTWLGRDPTDTQYFFFGLPCGHHVRRQFELIRRKAEGICGIRCDICHAAVLEQEAAASGWTLIGKDPNGDPRYRLYRHSCGAEDRIARTNLQTRRFACRNCDSGWVSEKSYLYAMRFALSSGLPAVKIGFSRDPDSRLRYQLARHPYQPCALLKAVPFKSGHDANRVEKRLHALLRRKFPASVLPRAAFQDRIRVRTEVYAGTFEPVALALLDAIAMDPTHPLEDLVNSVSDVGKGC